MGFFQKLKHFFIKPLEVNKNSLTEVISFSKNSGKIPLNKHLTVPSGFECIFVCKEKICDKFTEGEYKLDINRIPMICRKLKLNVPNKKGKYKNSFKADVYFINKSEFTGKKFSSVNGSYIKKDKEFLGFTAGCRGVYSYKVFDPELLLETLLKCYAIVRGGLAQRRIDLWTGICVERKIEKNRPSAEQLFERQSVCFEGMTDYLNKNMRDVGVEYTQVDITQTLLPKNIYRKADMSFTENINEQEQKEHKIEMVLENQKAENNINFETETKQVKLEPVENILIGQNESENNIKLNKNAETNNINQTNQNTLQLNNNTKISGNKFDNNEDITSSNTNLPNKIDNLSGVQINSKFNSISEIENLQNENSNIQDNLSRNSQIDNSKMYNQINENASANSQNEISNESYAVNSLESEDIPKTTVDDIENLQNKITYKKCKYCGSINPKNAKVCFNCKKEFKKICEKCGAEIDNGNFVCPKCKSIVI